MNFPRFLSRFARSALMEMRELPVRLQARSANDSAGELYVYDIIGDSWDGITAKQVAVALAEMKGVKSLSIRINSPGGDVSEATAISSLLRDFKGEKTVHVDGLAASAATTIAMVGDRIITSAAAMWMIHDPWSLAVGTAQDLRASADVLDKVRDIMLDVYSRRTGGTRGQISQWMTDETWMTAAEAKARGFTDEIDGGGDCSDEDEECAALVEAFRPSGYELLSKYKRTPAALRRRGPDQARLAEARSHALRIRSGRSPANGATGVERKSA